jgi:hypothetical protein
MKKELLKKYITLRAKREALLAEEEVVRAEILKDMQTNKETKIESDFGSFTVVGKKTWVFSKKVKTLEETLKIEKAREQEKGIAKFTEKEYLLFKENSEEAEG